MMFLKISILLIFSVLYAQTSITKGVSKPWQYTRKMISKTDDDSNCICYPKGQLPSIHNILDANNSGQERIVVYFYKNIGSNEIKMYTPSSDKQLLIPDLPYDSGDQLVSVTTETINTLFYSNSNRIKIYDNQFEKLEPGETAYWPIGLNLGAVEHVYPKVKDPPIDNNNNQNIYNFDGVPNGYTVYDPKEPTEVSKPEVATQISSPNSGIKPNENSQIPSFGIDPNNYKKQFTFSFHPNDGSYLNLDDADINSPSIKQYVIFDVWFKEQLKNFQHYNLSYELQYIDFYVLKKFVQQILYNNNIRVGPDDILRYSNGVALEPADLELRPLFIGQTFDHKLMQASPPDNIILPKHLPYIEGILVTLVYPPQVLGLIPLGKTYLSKQSYQVQAINNSSTIFPNGYVDTKYVPYPTNNGQQFNTQKFQSSVNRPGFNSFFNFNKPVISYPYSNLDNGINWILNTNKYSSASVPQRFRPLSISQQPYLTHYWESLPHEGIPPLGSERRKLSDVKIKHHIDPPSLKNKKQLYSEDILVKPESKEKEEEKGDSNVDSLMEPFINVNASESGRRFQLPSIKGVVKSLLYLLSESRSAEDDKLSSNSTEDVDITNESENINDGERPDYRIIGGNAATGSGTPLSNKGRSANIETSSK